MELRKVYSTGTIIAICAMIVTIHAASAAPMVGVEPSYLSVSQGDMFTVNITIEPDSNQVMGAQYDLYFNNTVLRAIDQTSGEFLSQDGVSTNVYTDEIDNTLGRIEYSEARTGVDYGVTNPGVLATIKFEIRCPAGVSELHLDKVKLSDPVPAYISGIIVNNATVAITDPSPPTPFLISGYVSYEDGSDCNDPAVGITNLNTSREWTAGTDANYYQLMLSSCADVIADEVLCFNVTSPDGSSNITEHTVTQDEVGDGGFELNITLEGSVFDPVITSCNGTGAGQDEFYPGDSVWVKGTGLAADTPYTIWIQNDPVNDSDTLDDTEDPSGSQETVTTEADGSFGPIEIWSAIPAGAQVNYDIVVDNQDGVYNAADDGIDSASAVGIIAPIPELASIALLAVGLLMLIGLMRFKREE